MDGHLYHYFCVILIDCIGFVLAFAYFRLNRMSRSRKGLWSSGISRLGKCLQSIMIVTDVGTEK